MRWHQRYRPDVDHDKLEVADPRSNQIVKMRVCHSDLSVINGTSC